MELLVKVDHLQCTILLQPRLVKWKLCRQSLTSLASLTCNALACQCQAHWQPELDALPSLGGACLELEASTLYPSRYCTPTHLVFCFNLSSTTANAKGEDARA